MVMREKKILRVYRRYQEWEEVAFNMWGEVADKQQAVSRAIVFTGDDDKYGHYMMRVVYEWPVSCENALTDLSINRKAWIGHAAVALALNIPENITRIAWGSLSYEQQLLANKKASRAISVWEHNYRESNGLCDNVGNKMLF